jgi:hypothetical protein
VIPVARERSSQLAANKLLHFLKVFAVKEAAARYVNAVLKDSDIKRAIALF